jgi:hypothetical protein
MGLFGGGNSKKTTNNNYTTDQSYNDESVQIDNSTYTTDQSYNDESVQIDNSVTNVTDGGAFDLVGATVDDAFEFGDSALDVAKWSGDNSRDVTMSSLNFGQSVVDRAFDASENTFMGAVDTVRDSNRMNAQTVTGALDKTLALAANRSATQSENIMSGVQKIALGLGAVVAVGFIANAVKK